MSQPQFVIAIRRYTRDHNLHIFRIERQDITAEDINYDRNLRYQVSWLRQYWDIVDSACTSIGDRRIWTQGYERNPQCDAAYAIRDGKDHVLAILLAFCRRHNLKLVLLTK